MTAPVAVPVAVPIAVPVARRGAALAYRVCGEGPPVLLIQGVGVHGDAWAPQTATLSACFRCLSFDNRGIGCSLAADGPLTVAGMADDALALMDAQGWDSAHVVGHSMGGLLALHLALTAPTRVRSLALLCAFATGRAVTRPSPAMLWLGIRSRVGSREMRRRAFLRMIAPPDVLARPDFDETALARRLAAVFGHDLADQPPVAMRQLAAMRGYDALPRLGALADVPTLVVSAAHDPIAPPRFGRAIAAAIPGARYVELDAASHGVPVLQPARVNTLLLEHLGGA